MGGSLYDPDRMCYAPGTQHRGLDFRLNKEKVSSTFGDPDDPLGTPNWVISLAEAEADAARAREQYAQMLTDAGVSDAEFRALAAYIRDQAQYGVTPTDGDLENFVLSRRPQMPRHPGIIDPRGHYFPGLQAAAWVTPIVPYVEVLAPLALSIALDFVPYLGPIKIVVESIRGKDTITGDEIPLWARLLGPLGLAASNAGKIVKVVGAAARLARATASAAKLRIGVRLLGPLLAIVAHARVPPAEAVRILDRLAQVDIAAARTAKAEAEVAGGVLAFSRAQATTLRGSSALLRAEQIAEMERTQSRMAAAAEGAVPKAPVKGGAAADEALAAETAAGKQRGRRPARRPGGGRPPLDPTRVFNKTIRAGSAALRRLLKRGLSKKWLTAKLKKLLPYRYQMQVTGKDFEYAIMHADGELIQLDGLADSVSKPGKLDIIEAKFGFVEKIEKSGHIAFGDAKIKQLTRLAQFAEANQDEIGKVIVVVGGLKDAERAGKVAKTADEIVETEKALRNVGEAYLNLREALPAKLRKFVEIVDEASEVLAKGK